MTFEQKFSRSDWDQDIESKIGPFDIASLVKDLRNKQK